MTWRDWLVAAVALVVYVFEWITSERRVSRLVRAIEQLAKTRDHDA